MASIRTALAFTAVCLVPRVVAAQSPPSCQGVGNQCDATTCTVTTSLDFVDSVVGDGICGNVGDGCKTCSLRAAIMELNWDKGGTITFKGVTSSNLSIPGNGEDMAANGDLDIRKPMTIIGPVTVDGAGMAKDSISVADRIFHVIGTFDVQFDDVNVINGNAVGGNGGGILLQPVEIGLGPSFVMNRGSVTNNRTLAAGANTATQYAGYGGGIAAITSQLKLKGVDISGNTTYSGGGGIASIGLYDVAPFTALGKCSVVGNQTTELNSADGGGGIWSADTTLIIDSSVVAKNQSGCHGGGIALHARQLKWQGTITQTNFESNSAGTGDGVKCMGGGLSVDGDLVVLDIEQSTFTTNYAPYGGGIAIAGGNVVLGSSTVAQNYTGQGSPILGGGVYLAPGFVSSTRFVNDTITANKASSLGGGIYVGDAKGMPNPAALLNFVTIAFNVAAAQGGGLFTGDTATTLVNASILSDNDATAAMNCAGTVNSQGYNVVADNQADSCSAWTAKDLLATNAQLVALANNGGPTTTHALKPASPAIDLADTCLSFTPASATIGQDQRTVLRNDGKCDAGAYELTKTDLGVVKGADKTGVVPGDSVTFALTVSNAGPGTANATVTDVLPANLVLVATSIVAQGGFTCTAGAANDLSCTNPAFAPGTATISYQARVAASVRAGDLLTNRVALTSDLFDANGSNDSSSVTLTTAPPTVSIIATKNTTEPSVGTSTVDLTVTLSHGSNDTVSVTFTTADGTAVAGSDYVGTGGTLTFAPGEVVKTISVTINADAENEDTETFTVTIQGAVAATLGNPTCTVSLFDILHPAPPEPSATGAGTEISVAAATGDTTGPSSPDEQPGALGTQKFVFRGGQSLCSGAGSLTTLAPVLFALALLLRRRRTQ